MRLLPKFSSFIFTLLVFAIIIPDCPPAYGARIKDIASFKGVRDNQLVGYGLVVGLNGTGDGASTQFTNQALVNMMEHLGVHILSDQVKVANVAGVMVTAELPPFAKTGSSIDVLVSSIGDSSSLQGGTLLMAPLKGADNKVYAVAQGPILVGGYASSGAAGGGVSKNHPTVARIPGGAIIEREILFALSDLRDLTIALNQPDFTTALRVSKAINQGLGSNFAEPVDSGTIRVDIPDTLKKSMVDLIASVEQIDVTLDLFAKIVLAERTGTVVMGKNVRISSVAIAHGNLSVQIEETSNVSQPSPFSEGETTVTPETEISVSEDENKLMVLDTDGAALDSLVRALNAIGVSPRDLITVFQAIKASGALHADLEII